MTSGAADLAGLLWKSLKGEQMSEEKNEESRNVAEALDDIFDDDPEKKAREKEIAKYEKKRRKAIEREEKKAAKNAFEKWNKKPSEESPSLDDDKKSEEQKISEAEIYTEDGELDEKTLKRKLKAEKKAAKKKAAEEKEVNVVKDLLLLCLYILAVVVLCWVILTFVGQRTEVSGESMSNTLHSGDTLWIDKLEYEFGSPKRYDVVVFPPDTEDEETFFIKRIIGLPGETVYIDTDGTIYINDEPLLDDVYGREVISEDQRGLAAEEITLGEDEYFVLGDNRNNSRDSRVPAVGNVHKKDIIGRAVFRFTGGFGKIK